MKHIVLLVVLTMATSSFTLAQMAADKSAPKGQIEQELTKLEQDRAQATVKGDTAFIDQNTADDYITGRSTQKGQAYGQDAAGQYRFTRVYVKQDGKWKAVAFQSTRVAE